MPDKDSSSWRILEAIAIGNHSLEIDGTKSLAETQARIEALSEPESRDPQLPTLLVEVDRQSVTAHYVLSSPPQRALDPDPLGNLMKLVRRVLTMAVRPVFRGLVFDRNGSVRLRGWFGVSTFVRALAFASLTVVVAGVLSWVLRIPLAYANIAWIISAAFLVFCLLTRANSDDIGYISKNLEYALRGDEG